MDRQRWKRPRGSSHSTLGMMDLKRARQEPAGREHQRQAASSVMCGSLRGVDVWWPLYAPRKVIRHGFL